MSINLLYIESKFKIRIYEILHIFFLKRNQFFIHILQFWKRLAIYFN